MKFLNSKEEDLLDSEKTQSGFLKSSQVEPVLTKSASSSGEYALRFLNQEKWKRIIALCEGQNHTSRTETPWHLTGGAPVVHRCPAPLFDTAIYGPPVAIDKNENLKNGLCA